MWPHSGNERPGQKGYYGNGKETVRFSIFWRTEYKCVAKQNVISSLGPTMKLISNFPPDKSASDSAKMPVYAGSHALFIL